MKGIGKRRPKYEFPMCMRLGSLAERREFYSNEFKLDSVTNWLHGASDTVFAVILGRYSRIFPREYARIADNTIIIHEYDDLADLREYILQYLPESVYYDRNRYRNRHNCSLCNKGMEGCWECEGFLGQELAFDLDVENVYCPLHGDLDQRMARHDHISFCEYDIVTVRDRSIELFDHLRSEFKKIAASYSGRGYHLHVYDSEAYSMSRKERGELADNIGERFPIDEWVTEGESHLIRLPFSLNAIVSRKVLPLSRIELESFDPIIDDRCMPGYVGNNRIDV